MYGVATTDDLLQSLLQALLGGAPNEDARSDLNRKGIMKMSPLQAAASLVPWFKQPGYPVITVQDQRDNPTAPQLTFTQDRFLRMGAPPAPSLGGGTRCQDPRKRPGGGCTNHALVERGGGLSTAFESQECLQKRCLVLSPPPGANALFGMP